MREREFHQTLLARERPLVDLPKGGSVRVALAYPNRYWVAMSNLGFQTVFKLLSEVPRFDVERAFMPEYEPDYFKTFERAKALSELEILGVSVSFETDYQSVLELLRGAGLELNTRRESVREPFMVPTQEGQRPLILGGGAALTLNPEPLANFFDAILIGEAEEAIAEIAECYLKWRDNEGDFEELLQALSEIEGVYVPAFYNPRYQQTGEIKSISSRTGVPSPVMRRYLEDISSYPTTTVIQTPDTEFKSMFMTETGRGCEVGCKFCVAGYMYRPTRKRSAESLRQSVKLGLEVGESVGFVGASVSSHRNIAELASSVASSGKRASLSSIMSQRVSKELAASLSESEYKTVALAPEAGSEQLRFRMGKRVCNDQIHEAVRLLAANGIRNFKFYIMVGLPTEEREDVEAIVTLVRELRETAFQAASKQENFTVTPRIQLSVNPFIPKAWTPFQRHPFPDFKTIKAKIALVEKGISRVPNVEMKYESPRESFYQAVLSRGDRRVGDILLELLDRGQDWRELVRRRKEQIVPTAPSPEFYADRKIEVDEVLPWEVADLRIKRGLLDREYERTFTDDVTPLITRARREFLESMASDIAA